MSGGPVYVEWLSRMRTNARPRAQQRWSRRRLKETTRGEEIKCARCRRSTGMRDDAGRARIWNGVLLVWRRYINAGRSRRRWGCIAHRNKCLIEPRRAVLTRRWCATIIMLSLERTGSRRHAGGRCGREDLATGSEQQDKRNRERRAHCTDQALASSTPE